MRSHRWLFAGLVAAVVMLSGCKDKNLECALKCGEEFDKGKTKCGKQDAACWAPFHANYKACTASCDKQFPKK